MNLFQRDRDVHCVSRVPRRVPSGRLSSKVFNLKANAASRKRGHQSLRNRHAVKRLLRKLDI